MMLATTAASSLPFFTGLFFTVYALIFIISMAHHQFFWLPREMETCFRH